MTPRLARITLSGFVLLAAGVATNALFFQPRPGLASIGASIGASRMGPDRAAARVGPERAREPAPAGPTAKPRMPVASGAEQRRLVAFEINAARVERLGEGPSSDAGAETIRAVQRELKARDYGPIGVDGVPGLATRAAIMAFEADNGLALTGEASETVLKRILLGVSAAGPDDAAATTPPSPRASEVIRAVQNWLVQLGYQPGPADGRLSSDTVSAIRFFEMDKGLVPKGRISADLVTRLADAVPLKAAGR
jgi:peptidoglycan hydrolase-like protein with peptidoglycan-binding domain